MQADTLFWGIAGAIALVAILIVFAPMLRGQVRDRRGSSYDMQVYRDQLREVESDLARGVLGEDEARATRNEVSRRLLAAADAEAREAGPATAPRRLSRPLASVLMVAVLVATGGLYTLVGAPGYPDRPLKQRLAEEAEARANRPRQSEAEAIVAREAPPRTGEFKPGDLELVERLRQTLEARPNDLQGHRLLARSLATLGLWSEARAAQGQVIEILGDRVTARDLLEWAELMILAAGGYVSPEAEMALGGAMRLEPENPLGRYYSGLALLQANRADLAYGLWTRLLEEGPADAPWIAPIEAQIDKVAQLAGQPPPAPAGPTRSQMDATADMPAEERQAMIEGMVSQLAERLGSEGGPPEEWARLIRSLGVLGRMRDADATWQEARTAFADDPAALAMLEAAARDADLTQ